jgi:hypothetical protein
VSVIQIANLNALTLVLIHSPPGEHPAISKRALLAFSLGLTFCRVLQQISAFFSWLALLQAFFFGAAQLFPSHSCTHTLFQLSTGGFRA